MDEDQIQMMRERIAASSRKVGLSFDDVRETTTYSQNLLDQYISADSGASGVAAFRIDAYLTEPTNHPIAASELKSIADALRTRISGHALAKSDLRIGLALYSFGAFDRDDVGSLVASMKGGDDFAVASEAAHLLPILGIGFIQDYLTSTELFETGGMGGPQRPLIREMAEESLREFNALK